MPVVEGTSFTATLVDPGGLTSGVGARVEVPVTRAVVSMWVAATLAPGGTVWSVLLDAPLTAGEYNLVWRDGGPEPPAYEIFVPLVVIDAGLAASLLTHVDYPPVDAGAVTPTVEDVAQLERTRTRSEDGTEFDTFNDRTDPKALEVQALIDQSVPLVLSQLRKDFDPRHYDDVKTAITLMAAILIEGSFFRNQNEAAYHNASATSGMLGVWRTLYSQTMSGLMESIKVDLEQAGLLGAMEPRVLV